MKRVVLLALLVFYGVHLHAQSDSVAPQKIISGGYCEVRLIDESVYGGFYRGQNDSLIFLQTNAGVLIQIPKQAVRNMEFVRRKVSDTAATFVVSEPKTGHRYYVLCSAAMPFKKESVFISSSYLLFYNINYAFSRYFAMGISTSIIGAPMALQVKTNFELGQHMYAGFEAAAGSMLYQNPKTYAYGGVAKLTFGNVRKHYTFFAGFADLAYWVASRRGRGGRSAINANYYQRYNSPFAGVAAALPMSGRFSFAAEAFAFPNISIYTGSFALRTVARRNSSLVFGFQILGNTHTTVNKAFVLPYFGFSARF